MAVNLIDDDGNPVAATKAKERGTYRDANGVPRLVVEGDPIPLGWEKVADDNEHVEADGVQGRGARAKGRVAPSENK